MTIGNFDGVHLGHRLLIEQALQHAESYGWGMTLYTFEPHPASVLRPELAPIRLTPQAEKLRLLKQAGVPSCIVEPFDADFASMSAERFVQEVLIERLAARQVVVGYDFTFGHKGLGTLQTLERLLRSNGCALEVVAPHSIQNIVISSTKIRGFLLSGNVEGAQLLLGRAYALEGVVVHGDQRGRTLGFPTANIATNFPLLPRLGVYACLMHWRDESGEKHARAVVNVGLRPTVTAHAKAPQIEAHLFDFSGDLYDKSVRLEFISSIREERRFHSLEALKAQIAEDSALARERLTSYTLAE